MSTIATRGFIQGGLAVGAGICMGLISGAIAAEATKYLGRLIYPMSKFDRTHVNNGDQPDFVAPNIGFRVHKEQYEALSTTRKVANAAAVVLCGAAIGALSGATIAGVVGFACYHSTWAVTGFVIGAISGAIGGAVTSPRHDLTP